MITFAFLEVAKWNTDFITTASTSFNTTTTFSTDVPASKSTTTSWNTSKATTTSWVASRSTTTSWVGTRSTTKQTSALTSVPMSRSTSVNTWKNDSSTSTDVWDWNTYAWWRYESQGGEDPLPERDYYQYGGFSATLGYNTSSHVYDADNTFYRGTYVDFASPNNRWKITRVYSHDYLAQTAWTTNWNSSYTTYWNTAVNTNVAYSKSTTTQWNTSKATTTTWGVSRSTTTQWTTTRTTSSIFSTSILTSIPASRSTTWYQ